MKKKLLGYYNYTVVLTYIGMLFGFFGIFATLNSRVCQGLFCLMIAGLCDMFDGAIASTMVRTDDEKCFGIQIDSLSDLICFGVLPASIIVNVYSRIATRSFESAILFAVTGLYVLCALIRLAYFNVTEQNRQKETTEPRHIYYGLPVTSIAVLLPLLFEICSWLYISPALPGVVALFIVAVGFILPFRLKKPHRIGKLVLAVGGLLEFYALFLLRGRI